MSKLDEKLIDAYTILLMGEELLEDDIPETVIESGKSLREEVLLEQARRVIGIVPEPIDNKVISRIEDMENTLDVLLGDDGEWVTVLKV